MLSGLRWHSASRGGEGRRGAGPGKREEGKTGLARPAGLGGEGEMGLGPEKGKGMEMVSHFLEFGT